MDKKHREVAFFNDDVVVIVGPLLLAHANGHHLEKPAFQLSLEIRMGFDPVDHDNMVRFGGVFIQIHPDAVRRGSHLLYFHGRMHRRAHCFVGDAVVGQKVFLPFRRGPAMASHGRKNKGFGPQRLDLLYKSGQHLGHVGDAPAARGDGDGFTGPDAFVHPDFRQLFLHRFGYVFNGMGLKFLPNANHFR